MIKKPAHHLIHLNLNHLYTLSKPTVEPLTLFNTVLASMHYKNTFDKKQMTILLRKFVQQ